jgi:nucleoside-diphosphate-sugar epimerase
MDSTLFVTGGSGFLGRQLITDLVAEGYRVRALARSERSAAVVRALGAEAVSGDLDDLRALQAGMEGCRAVIHCAAKVEQWGRWEDFLRDTVEGTKNVVAAARAAGVARLLHVGTEAVLADGSPIVNADETRVLPEQANGFYPRSKGMAEQYVLAANGHGLETVVVRPRFIWGKGDTSLLPKLAAAARKGWVWFGGGSHRTSSCHVRNVSLGIRLALEKGRAGQIYFLTDGEPVVFRDFIGALIRSQGVDPGARTAPLWLADVLAALGETVWRLLRLNGEPPITRTSVNLFFREVTVNDAKARRELGYTPVISVDDGLKELRATSVT